MIRGKFSGAVLALVAGLLAGCSGSSSATEPTVTAGSAATLAWSAPDVTGQAHTGRGPDFPTALDGWTEADEWTVTDRAFTEGWWKLSGPDLSDFPATMSGCASLALSHGGQQDGVSNN